METSEFLLRPSPNRRRIGRCVGFSLLLCGCGQVEPPELPTPLTREQTPYTPLPPELRATLQAVDFALLRCGYFVDERWQTLDCEIPVAEFPPAARRELEAALTGLSGSLSSTSGSPAGPPTSPRRVFQLNLRSHWVFDIEIVDHGFDRPITLQTVGSTEPPRVLVRAGNLSAELRRHALALLNRSGERPRRPLGWHAFAQADLIPPENVSGRERSASSRDLYERLTNELLDVGTTRRLSRLAALLVPSVDLLTDEKGATLLRSDVIVAQALALTRMAGRGDASALREVFRLAMEYGGDLAVFVAAARHLFPAALNASLVARHPPSRDRDEALQLMATIRRAIEHAEYVPSRGWRLPIE